MYDGQGKEKQNSTLILFSVVQSLFLSIFFCANRQRHLIRYTVRIYFCFVAVDLLAEIQKKSTIAGDLNVFVK